MTCLDTARPRHRGVETGRDHSIDVVHTVVETSSSVGTSWKVISFCAFSVGFARYEKTPLGYRYETVYHFAWYN